MEYYRILNLVKEPFSNSPDPDFFYQSPQHTECLQKAEIAIRLRRGLMTVIGDVGTGKTTLCRQLLRKLSGDEHIETHLMLDPDFGNSVDFLTAVGRILGVVEREADGLSEWEIKERIKNYIFKRGIDDNTVVVLAIDEGQRIPSFGIEILREFLNYETNENKLLQLVIFAQKEFADLLWEHKAFADRVSTSFYLSPLSFKDTKKMIIYRLDVASGNDKSPVAISPMGLWMIYRATDGYSRRIIHLCHHIMVSLIVRGKTAAGYGLVRETIEKVFPREEKRIIPGKTVMAVFAVVVLAVLLLFNVSVETNGIHRGIDAVETHVVSVSRNITAIFDETPGTDEIGDGELKAQTVSAVNRILVGEAVSRDNAGIDASSCGTGSCAEACGACPPVLGTVVLSEKTSIESVIRDIYGDCTQERIDRLYEANAFINSHKEISGTVILPRLCRKTESRYTGRYFVRILDTDSMRNAYWYYRHVKPDMPAAFLVPAWKKDAGLRCMVAVGGIFETEKQAREYCSGLSNNIVHYARIVPIKNADVFFTDRL